MIEIYFPRLLFFLSRRRPSRGTRMTYTRIILFISTNRAGKKSRPGTRREIQSGIVLERTTIVHPPDPINESNGERGEYRRWMCYASGVLNDPLPSRRELIDLCDVLSPRPTQLSPYRGRSIMQMRAYLENSCSRSPVEIHRARPLSHHDIQSKINTAAVYDPRYSRSRGVCLV